MALLKLETSSNFEKEKEYIYSLNFEKIINKMVMMEGWIRIDAEKTCEMFKNFLFLIKKNPDFEYLIPSRDVDEFWHMVILDTSFYRQICKTLFQDRGGYLDHYPYFGIDENSDADTLSSAFNATQNLYASEFNGQVMLATRSRYPQPVYWLMRKIT